MTDAEQQAYLAENLRALHLPTDSLWWPLAPGWWLTAVIVAILLITALFALCKRYLQPLQRHLNRQQNEKQTLAAYYDTWQADGDNTAYIHRVSTHLRKAAIDYADNGADNYSDNASGNALDNATGRGAVAKLSGAGWVNWLEQTSGYPLSPNTKSLLTSGLYESVPPAPDRQIHDEIAHCLSGLTTHRDSGDKQSSRHA